jgi:hypothetical protein
MVLWIIDGVVTIAEAIAWVLVRIVRGPRTVASQSRRDD